MALIKSTEEEEKRAEKLAKAMEDAVQKSAELFRQLQEASSRDLHDLVKTSALYSIEECRLNYDQALQELRRMEDNKRNDRLEAIARSSKNATWLAVLLALASLGISLAALLK